MKMGKAWIAAGMLAAGVVSASSCEAAQSVTGTVGVKGTVTSRVCTLGSVDPNDSIFDLGVLVDTATGTLRNNLSVPPKILAGSFCNTASVITISATPMVAHSSPETAPDGFASSVDYTATASGWTTPSAVFATSNSSNPGASELQPNPFAGDITVSLTGFSTRGGDILKLVADPLYQGVVTITLTVAA